MLQFAIFPAWVQQNRNASATTPATISAPAIRVFYRNLTTSQPSADRPGAPTAGRILQQTIEQSLYSDTMQKCSPRPVGRVPLGFTLIELLVTIAVAAVLLGIAAPSFRDMSIRNRLSGYSNDIITSVNFARSEAVRRGQSVSICKSSDGASCTGSWSDGWIIFVNADNDSPAVVGDDDEEPVLKVYGPVAANYSLGGDANFANDVTYGADGSATSTGVITVCHDGEIIGAKAVVLTRLRPRMARDTNADRIPNIDTGANIASCAAPSGA